MPREDGPAMPAQPDAKTLAGPAAASPLALRATDLQGVHIGPFEIKGLIGAGGFGDVFLAEQRDPVQRLAAIKMLKPTRQAERFRELFDAERRVLAQIDHPNVARILDAGSTADGRDWVAMEFAPGQPMTAFCDHARLGIEERVGVLATVLRAVDFAHEKGVVHRDLKPSNVLVSVDGGQAVPKVIDFGIARVLGSNAVATEPDRVVGTPGYMAPEQTIGGGADADARADVYALGAMLFELCTGTLPLVEPGDPSTAAPGELSLRTRARDAPLMSQRVRSLPAEMAARIADDRRTTPRDLARQLQGDLDWIVAKCLDRDRMRRYPSAGDMGEDLRRWRMQRPVEAAPNAVGYRARKFVARNGAAVAFASLLAIAVVAGLYASVLAWQSALHERDDARIAGDRAEREAAEARAAASYIGAVLSAASLNRAPDGAALTVVELLHHAAQAADVELKDRPATEAVVRLALGKTYTTLGLLDDAQVQLLRANALADAEFGRTSSEMAETLEALAAVALLRGNYAGAGALLKEARETYTLQPGDSGLALARNRIHVAELAIESSNPTQALRDLQDAEQLARGAGAPGLTLLGSIDWYRSLAFLELGQFADALKAIERNLAHNRSTLPADHWWIAESETARAAALAGLGRAPEALANIQSAMPTLDRALLPGAPTLRKAYARAAYVADKAGAADTATQYRAQAERPPPVQPALPPGTPGRAATLQGTP